MIYRLPNLWEGSERRLIRTDGIFFVTVLAFAFSVSISIMLISPYAEFLQQTDYKEDGRKRRVPKWLQEEKRLAMMQLKNFVL